MKSREKNTGVPNLQDFLDLFKRKETKDGQLQVWWIDFEKDNIEDFLEDHSFYYLVPKFEEIGGQRFLYYYTNDDDNDDLSHLFINNDSINRLLRSAHESFSEEERHQIHFMNESLTKELMSHPDYIEAERIMSTYDITANISNEMR